MPKIVAAARVASIVLSLSCLVPGLPARGALPEVRSAEVGAVGGRGRVLRTTRAPDALRVSCPPRWPDIDLTCTA
ncbi:hypothetical protein ASF55_09925 [Methylobacterium sp. Leaf119]|nr:hypothetical protein ASF55_09925 [Methylobacterium sp. Leaf119]